MNLARTPVPQLRAARQRLLDDGDLPDGLVDPALRQSWLRSRRFGLAPTGRPAGAPHASSAQLVRAIEHQRELVAHARPVMEFLFEQTSDSDSVAILADANGLLLHALGDTPFVDRAERVALRPGAVWHEQWRGTNAIGTALAERAPVVVHGSEHYLERNRFLTCAAAPIFDPAGKLLGVLDVSGDHRGYHRHTLGLVKSAARMIEHRLFETRHGSGLRLRLHAQPEGIGTVTEALLALSEDGWIVGANGAALKTFGLTHADIGAVPLDRVLALDWATLDAWRTRPTTAPRTVRRSDGEPLWLRIDAGRSVVVSAPARPRPAAPVADQLGALDTGDPALKAAIERARRVQGKSISLLLHGESGTGKELFARALHASSPRAGGPFVAVNCAALPDSLIEAELFGYRPGAFTGASRDGAPGRIREADGGTLFLDEIGDMPLALQARLLRVLQERSVVPLGGGKPVAVDFQLVCATHRNLQVEMDAGRFRSDLYYRLNGLTLQLPPLRERHDLGALVGAMLREAAPGRDVALAADVARAFGRHRWPGNLRQLANALRTACALMADDEFEIDWHHLPDDLAEALRGTPVPRPVEDPAADLRELSSRTVEQVVQSSGGNLSHAARRLGISRNTLYRKLKQR